MTTGEDTRKAIGGTSQYGGYYFCVKVKKVVSTNGEIYLMADSVTTTPDGALVFSRKDATWPSLILASGTWTSVYAASVIDGHAVAVDHWAGEILE